MYPGWIGSTPTLPASSWSLSIGVVAAWTNWDSRKKRGELTMKNGYGSIPINTIFRGMTIHLPAILMWTTGVQGFDTLPNGEHSRFEQRIMVKGGDLRSMFHHWGFHFTGDGLVEYTCFLMGGSTTKLFFQVMIYEYLWLIVIWFIQEKKQRLSPLVVYHDLWLLVHVICFCLHVYGSTPYVR